MNLHTKRKVSLLYLVKDQLIYLSFHGRQNHLRVRSNTLSGRLLQVRLNQESILVEIVRPSIWQLRGSLGTRDLNIGAVCGKLFTDSVTSKDGRTFPKPFIW